MMAEDYNGEETRLSAVEKDARHIIEEFHGARYSIITFANSSEILIPLTKDEKICIQALETMKIPSKYYASRKHLKRAIR
ncbi:MAG: VWA domain-containing protein [Clostridia bacterium]|nr:VWA domain-containing protein [Clostridia bacterium]